MSNLENTTGLFVDKAWYTLDTSSASQSPDGRLSDTLDVITKNLPVTLCASLAKTFATLASARHVCKTAYRQLKAVGELVGLKAERNECVGIEWQKALLKKRRYSRSIVKC